MNCQQCLQQKTAYTHDELPPSVRRRVVRHLNTCESCYTTYIQEWQLAHDLTQAVSRIGQPPRSSLAKVWLAVDAERQRTVSHQRFAVFQGRYGVAMLLLALTLILPLTMGSGGVTWAAPPTQPAPHSVVANRTPAHPSAVGTLVALNLLTEPVNTPDARPDVRPVPDTTSTP